MGDNYFSLKESVLAKVPDPLPSPFSNFNPDWQKWVRKLDGQAVVLEFRQADGQYAGRGYDVISEVPGGNFVSWLPEIWLEKIPPLKFKAGDLVRVNCLADFEGRRPCSLNKKIARILSIDSLNHRPYVINGLLHSESELSSPKIEVGDRVQVLHSGVILEVFEVTSSAACITGHYWNPFANLELVSYDTPITTYPLTDNVVPDNQNMALLVLKEELSVLRSERDQFRIQSEELLSRNVDLKFRIETEYGIANNLKLQLEKMTVHTSEEIKDLKGQLTLTQVEVERLKNPRKNPQISQISLVSRWIRPQIYLEQINVQNPDQFNNPFLGGGFILIKMMLLPFLCLFKLGKFGVDQVKKRSHQVVEGYCRLLAGGKELRTHINTMDPGIMFVTVIFTVIMSFYIDIIYLSRVWLDEEDKAAAVVGPQHIPSPSDPREAALIEKRATQKAAQIKKDWK